MTTNNTDRSSKVFVCIVIRNAGTAAAGIGTAVDICTVCLIKYIVEFYVFLNINGASEENVLVPSVIQIK